MKTLKTFLGLLLLSAPFPALCGTQVSVWIPDYPNEFQQELAALTAHAKTISEASVQCYKVLSDGSLEPKSLLTTGGITLLQGVCAANGVKLFGMVHNEFDADSVHAILNNPALMAQHIQALVTMCQTNGFDGVDICYEKLYSKDRNLFSQFIQGLGNALHTKGKLLSVAIHAKTSEPGDWSGPQSQDWQALGKSVDLFQIMAFCFHDNASAPGPLAPLSWFNQVLQFGVSLVAPSKIRMGLAAYGVEWVGNTGLEESVPGAVKVADFEGVPLQWDAASQSAFFNFTRMGVLHTTWLEDARSVPGKLQAVQTAGLGGVSVWRLGGEGAGFWDAVGKFVQQR